MSKAEFSTFADGEDCPECQVLEKKVVKLEDEVRRLRGIVNKLQKGGERLECYTVCVREIKEKEFVIVEIENPGEEPD